MANNVTLVTSAGEETPPVHQPRSRPRYALSFSNLTYAVKLNRKMPFSTAEQTKVLLSDVSGEARDSEILAVLGASGSGKSTLIDALANRMAKGSLQGEVTLNGEQLESTLLKLISTYVMQDDLLFPMLTVEETLMFAAEFRLPNTVSKSMKQLRARDLIAQLGLQSAAKTIIGDEGHRGISGGERRRVSIGMDIIHDPIILFLDEPTSGLDSSSAFVLVKVLKRIAQSGSIVVMSVHQPSHRILEFFDRILILSHGQAVYSGSPINLPLFFSDFGHSVRENENQAEAALDLILELEDSPGGTNSMVEFNKSWQQVRNSSDTTTHGSLSLKEAISASIARGKLVSGTELDARNIMSSSDVPLFANSVFDEVVVLVKRTMINARRMPEVFGVRQGTVLLTGFIMATTYWKLDTSPKGIQERLGFILFAISTMFHICAEAIPIFLQERYVFMRETAYNAYRRSSYVLSQSLVVLPSLLFSSLVFATITFWAVGLGGGVGGFCFYVLIILASFWAGSSFVTFLSGIVPHVMLGYTIVIAILAYFLLFSGYYINRDRIPPYFIWFHYMSLFKYPYEAVLKNEFEDKTKCFASGVQIFDNMPLGSMPTELIVELLKKWSSTLGLNITRTTCVSTGMDVMRKQGLTALGKWSCLLITVAWGVFFRILFYISLLLRNKNRRR
ncbi:hypothetical protein RJ639_010400 [Escallonia herrerae]|uniref:ABC transporter domain-containing protein n=1 Tax=Escallonia herrerae TaxID=1293975 RepID=A0AA89ASL7_9ASTE|nr:hypothetical protein RJ639_010400 [Escallonia herrerae]